MVFYSSPPVWRYLIVSRILLGGAACRRSNSLHNFAGGRHPNSGIDQRPQNTLLEEHFGSNSWGTFLNFLRILYLLWIFQLMTGLLILSSAELCMSQLRFPWYQIGQVWPLPTGIPPSAESKPMNTTRIHLQHLNRFNTAQREVVYTMTVPFREYNLCVPWNGIQYHRISLKFVSVDLSVDISICHGSDGKEDGDDEGTATATFASVSWLACLREHTLPMLTLF